MRIWLLCVGEYLPIDPGHQRQLRMALLARTLHDAGHDVTWWCSTFDHEAKRLRFQEDTEVRVDDRYRIRLLHGTPYRRNISWQRLANHRQVANAFTRASTTATPPDVIVATVPTVELASAAARYAVHHNVPLIVDIRDQHPDIYLSLLPRGFRWLGRLALAPLFSSLHTALRSATSITATSDSFLHWGLRHIRRDRLAEDAVFPLAYPNLSSPEPTSRLAQQTLRKFAIDPRKRIVWYVGTFNRWIDLRTPIETARTLARERRDDFLFVFSGDGDHGPKWRALAAGLPNVCFTGWINEKDIAILRQAAWIGLAPYRKGFATLGNKLFEFMAGGLPIVSSLEGEPKRILESLGVALSYSPASSRSLTDTLKRLDANEVLYRTISDSGRAAYEQNFRAEVVYARMVQHIEYVAHVQSMRKRSS